MEECEVKADFLRSVTAQTSTHTVTAFLDELDAQDALLVKAGFPPMSPWWRAEVHRYFGALPGPRQWVLRVGRRGGKSSTLCRVAVAWARRGPWHVPPGDTGYVMFCSTKRSEAANRIATIAAILRALGVKHSRAADTITLAERNAAFRVFTASVAGVAGPTSIMAIGDEVALWRDAETGANPAREVFAQLRPTVATQPYAPIILSSSAYSKTDYHAEQFALGDTPQQRVSVAATWEANPDPSVAREATMALEPDERVWLRQYASVPQDAVTASWFGHEVIDVCVDRGRVESDAPPGSIVHVAADAAFRRDRFAVAAAVSVRGDRSDVRITSVLGTWAWGGDGATLVPSECVAKTAEVCKRYGTSVVWLDQFAAEPLREMFMAHGIYAKVAPWTAANKAAKFRAVREAMLERTFRLPDEPELLRELHGIAGELRHGGHERIEAADGYDDRVFAAVMAGHAAIEHGAHETREIAPPETEAERWARAIERDMTRPDDDGDLYY